MNMPAVTVVAKVVAKRECLETVKAELIKLIAPTRKEEGCIEYTLHQDSQDPAVFIFYENWSSEASLAGHMQSKHFISYINAIDGMIEDKAVHKMIRIEPGGES
jgi:quinol monooxygenase YgiN